MSKIAKHSPGERRFKTWLSGERGRVAQVARACGRSHSAVLKWDGKVPPEFVLVIEELSGISRHELRPDVFGTVAS